MKNIKRLIALALCLAMVLSLIGCGEQSNATVTDSTADSSSERIEETQPDAMDTVLSAIETVNSATSLSMRVTSTKTTRVGTEAFTEETSQILSCSGIGTEDVRYQSEEALSYSTSLSYSCKEIYVGGILYLTLESDIMMRSAFTAEEMSDRYAPGVLIDPSLYGSMEENGLTYTFTEPAAAESWVLPAGAEMTEASGSVTLNSDGTLKNSTYTITYTYGSATITLSLEAAATVKDVTIEAPADPDSYISVVHPDAARMVYSGVFYLYMAESFTSYSLESMFTQAAGYLKNQSSSMNSYNRDGTYLFKSEYSVYAHDYYRDETYEYDLEQTYIDGVYSYIEDGGEPVEMTNVSAAVIQQTYDLLRGQTVIDISYWQDAEVTDLGSLYLIELTLTDAFGEKIQDSVVSSLWDDPDFLNNLSSAYVTNEVTAYVGIDKYTGQLTSSGYYYEGCHTIDGDDYILSFQIDDSYTVPSLTAYKSICDEMPPEEVPENPATPLFYHVTGPDGQEMWLFGTIHIGDNRTGYLPQEIYDALASSDALALECDTEGFDEQYEEDEELQELVSDAYYYSDGTTIQDHIETELYDIAVKYMKATGNWNMNSDYLKASMWSNAIDNFFAYQGFQLTSDQGVEERLTKFAEDNGIPLREVESSLFQIQMMTGYSEELQEVLLEDSLSYTGEISWTSTMELYELWCAGDEAALMERLSDEVDISEMTEEELAEYEEYKTLLDEYNQAMSYDRNDGMLEVLIDYLESGDTVFVAVGLAHLLNNVNGLVFTLREAGYTVELVEFN